MKNFYIYKILIKVIAILLFSLKILYLYIAYVVVSDILKINGFISVILIFVITFSFNTLTEFVLTNIIEKKNAEEKGEINGK